MNENCKYLLEAVCKENYFCPSSQCSPFMQKRTKKGLSGSPQYFIGGRGKGAGLLNVKTKLATRLNENWGLVQSG